MSNPNKCRTKNIEGMTLQEVLVFADGVIKNNPGLSYEEFGIETDFQEYASGESSFLYYYTPMTDEEYEDFLKREKKSKERQKEIRRQQYEKLQKEFENE